MKVYVDSEIESCLDCPCHNGESGYCQITGKFVCDYVPKTCPPQSFTDHDKQVRKEMCNDFKSRFLSTCQIEKGCDTASFSLEVLNRILDQIQRGTK